MREDLTCTDEELLEEVRRRGLLLKDGFVSIGFLNSIARVIEKEIEVEFGKKAQWDNTASENVCNAAQYALWELLERVQPPSDGDWWRTGLDWGLWSTIGSNLNYITARLNDYSQIIVDRWHKEKKETEKQ